MAARATRKRFRPPRLQCRNPISAISNPKALNTADIFHAPSMSNNIENAPMKVQAPEPMLNTKVVAGDVRLLLP